MRLKTRFLDGEFTVEKMEYPNGRVALVLRSPEDGPVKASVNLPEAQCPDGFVYIKDVDENEGMLDALVEAGVVESPLTYARSGFVHFPLCRIMI
jgi:hypothetical protein